MKGSVVLISNATTLNHLRHSFPSIKSQWTNVYKLQLSLLNDMACRFYIQLLGFGGVDVKGVSVGWK